MKLLNSPSTEMSWMAKRRMMVQIIPRVIFTLPSTISESKTCYLKISDGDIRQTLWKTAGRSSELKGLFLLFIFIFNLVKVQTALWDPEHKVFFPDLYLLLQLRQASLLCWWWSPGLCWRWQSYENASFLCQAWVISLLQHTHTCHSRQNRLAKTIIAYIKNRTLRSPDLRWPPGAASVSIHSWSPPQYFQSGCQLSSDGSYTRL